MNKTVYVNANFARTGQYRTVQVPTGEVKKGLLGGEKPIMREEQQWVETGTSDCIVDGPRLAEDIDQAVIEINNEGYEVVSIMPVISGRYNYAYQANGARLDNHCAGGGYGYGYGYSYTEGVVIIARKV
jgi:hypothetical protein